MKKSVYRKAAEYIHVEYKKTESAFICHSLEPELLNEFKYWFMPTEKESLKYNMHLAYNDSQPWMSTRDCNQTNNDRDNQVRVLALLLMEQIEKDKKLRR